MDVYEKIEQYCEQGNDLFDEDDFLGAIKIWQSAFDVIPDLNEDWNEAVWLKVSIGDSYYMIDEYQKSLDALLDALNYPEAIENPFIHFRVGQCHYQLGDKEQSQNALLKAYMLTGKEIFDDHEDEGEFYYNFLSSNVQL
jgi:tetratricopeptide (TPR) repeat protein